MTRQIALLRAINLGATRRVPMADLREALEAAGYEDVATYLQSGNVVLTSTLAGARLESELEALLAERFGFDVPVLVRTQDEVEAVCSLDPLGHVADQPSRYLVTFLREGPAAAGLEAVQEHDVAPEQLAVHGRELYTWHPEGIHRSRLAALLGKHDVSTDGTARNWNTVRKLVALAHA